MVGSAHDVPMRIFGRPGQQRGSSGQELLFIGCDAHDMGAKGQTSSPTVLLFHDPPEEHIQAKANDDVYSYT